MNDPIYKIVDWIYEKIIWRDLSLNPSPHAIEFLKTLDQDKIYWDNLSLNPSPEALEFLDQNPDKIDYICLRNNQSPLSVELLKHKKTPLSDYEWGQFSHKNSPYGFELLKTNPEKINWAELSSNSAPGAIEILNQNIHLISWNNLCLNKSPEAMKILMNNRDKIDWRYLCHNPNPEALDMLENKELSRTVISALSRNHSEKAIKLLRKYPQLIDVWELCSSPHPAAIQFLRENLDKIDWDFLSMNKGAIPLLRENLDKIVWRNLAYNMSSEVFDLLILGLERKLFDWERIETRRNIWEILSSFAPPKTIIRFGELTNTQILNELNWDELSANPNIFELDKNRMKTNFCILKNEIIQKAMDPKRIERLIKLYNLDIMDLDKYL